MLWIDINIPITLSKLDWTVQSKYVGAEQGPRDELLDLRTQGTAVADLVSPTDSACSRTQSPPLLGGTVAKDAGDNQ